MNTQRLFYLFVMFASAGFCKAQSDTIFKKDSDQIICRISVVNNHHIFYMDQNEVGRFIDLDKVLSYTHKGVRTMAVKKPMPFVTNQHQDTVNVSDELAYFRTCFTKFHNQYTTGLTLTMIGGALTGSSFFMKGDETVRSALGIGGIVFMLVGTVTTFDAHKWIARAGWGVSGKGNTVQIYYRFK